MKKLSTATTIAVLLALFVATVALAMFTNGNFEAGNFSGWTKDATYLSNGINVGPPSSYIPVPVASVSGATVTDRTVIVDTAWMDTNFGVGKTCDPVTDGTTLGTGEVCLPHNGTDSAVVNYQGKYNAAGAKSNMNKLTQSGLVAGGDVAADGNYHIFFAYAPVLDKGTHTAVDQPFMYVRLIRVRAGSPDKTLFDKFSYPADLNPNWKISKTTTSVYYMDWQTYDLSYPAVELNAGDTLTIEVTAAGCNYTQGGHWGYVYVDDFGPVAPTGNVAPSITSISPAFDGTAGGALVTLTGTRFTGATAVIVDATVLTVGVGAGHFQIVDDNHITFNAPAHVVGTVDISVTNPSGSGMLASGFAYIAPPTITGGASGGGTAPSSGPVTGGTSVVISGTNLSGSTFTFDGAAAACVVNFAGTQATCTSPSHIAGAVNVVVTNSLGSDTSVGGFTYYEVPTITNGGAGGGISPNTGPAAGGTSVTISGTNFTGATSITFGGTAANLAACTVTATSITCPTPAHAAGAVDVVVTTPGGTTTSVGGFTYTSSALLNITNIAPNAGTTLGGTSVVITGTGFTGATGFTFGGLAATCTVVSDTQITCASPAHATGAVDVVVTTPLGTATSAGGFLYADRDTVGVFRPTNGNLYLKNDHITGLTDISINYGLPGDYPVDGDWDGNGTDTIGVYRNGFFYLRNSNTTGMAEIGFAFGQPGDQPVIGDWDGDGIDTVGVYRSSTYTFYLRNSLSSGTPDHSFSLGLPGDVGIAGDWTGKGFDTVGVYRPSNGVMYLKNTHTGGFAEIALNYGLAGDKPVTGDWNNDGIDTIGVQRNDGQFYLKNANTLGFADIIVGLGNPGDLPIAGNWDALP